MVPEGSTAALEKKKKVLGTAGSVVSVCVHIHQACWRLEDGAEMLPEAYSMCSHIAHCIYSHTQRLAQSAVSAGTNTKQSSWPQPSSFTSPAVKPYSATHSDQE